RGGEPDPRSRRLRREEWIEDPVQQLRRDPRARIPDAYDEEPVGSVGSAALARGRGALPALLRLDVRARGHALRGHRDRAAPLQRLVGIDEDVDEALLDEGPVAENRNEPRSIGAL